MMHDTMSGWERLEHVIEICWSARTEVMMLRHTALIDVSSYPADTEVPSFRPRGSAPSAAAGETRSTVPDKEAMAIRCADSR